MKLKKVLAATMAASMVMGLAGCGNSSEGNPNESAAADAEAATEAEDTADDAAGDEAATASNGGKTTINIRLMNDVVNIDKVLDVYYEETKDDPVLSNVDVNISWVSGADYTDKLSLAVTAQEDIDLMFCGGWQGLDGYIKDGSFKDLTAYFGNDSYPGLKAGFSDDLLTANSYNGSIVAIPLTECAYDIRGVIYREDLREKYGCAEITDWATYEEYLKTMKEHLDEEGLVVPWGVSAQQGLGQMVDSNFFEARRNNILGYTAGMTFQAAISDDGKTVLGVTTIGDDDSMFADFPAGFQENYIDAEYEKIPYWIENYCNTDCVSTQDDISSMFEAGMYAATYSTLTEWVTHSNSMKTTCPEAKLGFFAFDDQQRACVAGGIPSDMKAWNTLVVPAWSEKTDQVMAFLDWMFGSKEHHDLFQYGIEGEDWEAVGDNAYSLLDIDESKKYTMPAYSFTSNPNYVRYSSLVLENENVEKLMDYQYSSEAYTLYPVTGFTFDSTNVESEVATLNALYADFKGAWGAYGDDVTAKMQELNKNAKDAGLEKVREELMTQLQAYLDAHQ